MTEDERRASGHARRLVFHNLANGVPLERIMHDLKMSQLEIEQAQKFVSRKITEYLVLRRQPPIPCTNVQEIRWNRKRLLIVLEKIGDLDLSTQLILSKLTVQQFDHPEMIEGASRIMNEANSK